MTREQKLLHLINILEGVEENYSEDFDMSHWVKDSVDILDLIHNNNHCGFAGCAMGWACINHKFVKMGLIFNSYGDPLYTIKVGDEEEFSDYPCVKVSQEGTRAFFTGFDAVGKFFDLSMAEAEFIFFAPSYCVEEIEDYSVSSCLCRALINRGETTNPLLFSQDNSEEFKDESVTPRMVINRIKYLLENPIP